MHSCASYFLYFHSLSFFLFLVSLEFAGVKCSRKNHEGEGTEQFGDFFLFVCESLVVYQSRVCMSVDKKFIYFCCVSRVKIKMSF